MYEIATLKEKKLADLQEIAKNLGLKKTSALKKLDLIYQIIDHVSANPPEKKETPVKSEDKKAVVKPTAPKKESRPQRKEQPKKEQEQPKAAQEKKEEKKVEEETWKDALFLSE